MAGAHGISVAGGRASADGVVRLVQQLAPGGRLVRTRRLRGGVGARMDVLDIERSDQMRFKVSLRRFTRHNRSSSAEHVAHEYKVLQFVEKAEIAAPRPLLLDAEGRLFGVPAMVLSHLPGRPLYQPRDVTPWAKELAKALLTVHAVTPQRFDMSWLSVHLRDGIRAELMKREEFTRAAGPLASEVHSALEADIDRIDWPNATLVHDDFWPGNTIWRYGRLAGVVDWTHAELGDPRTDVSQCRIDLALIIDQDAADAFLAVYQALAPKHLPQVWYFDLFRGLRALLSYRHWLEGYHDAGLSYVTAPYFRRRIRTFLRRALDDKRREARNG